MVCVYHHGRSPLTGAPVCEARGILHEPAGARVQPLAPLILDALQAARRPLTARELLAALAAAGRPTKPRGLWSALTALRRRGLVVNRPGSLARPLPSYAFGAAGR